MKKRLWYIATVLIIFTISACSLFAPRYRPVEILVQSETWTLAWDPPVFEGSSAESELESYRVFYRVRGLSSWTLLSEIEADTSLSLKITPEELDYGYYEFAVSAVDQSGIESPLHESTDFTADPPTGWYVNWIFSR